MSIDLRGTIYIAGPMSGYKDFNFPEFDKYAEEWREQGWIVINPADLDRASGFNQEEEITQQHKREFMDRDCNAIIHACDAVFFMRGWENSKGARVEHALAVFLDLERYYG